MTLQSKSKITYITRLLLTSMFLATAWVSASAQTNTFPDNGNAGVGTTTPTLQTGTTNTMIEVKGTVNPGVGLTSTAAGGRQYFVYSSQANPGYFSVFDATAGADRFVISSSGNIGIGMVSPSAKLYVAGGGYGSVGGANQSAYALGAQSIAADASIYSYGAICSGNQFGNCASSGGVVIGINNTAAGTNIPNAGNTIFNNGGNVGIGLTVPTYKLDVNGEINATGLRINGTPISSGGSSQWSGTGPIYYTGGNVGIGTTNPGNYKLNISGPLFGTSTYTSYIADGLYGTTALPSRISTNNFNGGILFGYEDLGLGDYSPRVGLQQTYDITSSPQITTTKASIGLVRNGNITIRGGADHTEFVRIDNAGKVGIGIPPTYKLDVNGEINATGIRINGTPISAGGTSQWTGTSSIYYNGNVGIGTESPGAADRLVVHNSGSESATTINADAAQQSTLYFSSAGLKKTAIYRPANSNDLRFNIVGVGDALTVQAASGNVGIGTTNPGGRLHVSSSGLNAEIRITDTTTGNPYLSFYDGSTPKGYVQYSAGTMDFYAPTGVAARIVTNSVERIRIDTAGNVGIGKPDPQYKLDVVGDIKASGTIHAKYQDLAEWVPSSEQLSAGTVVVLDTTKSNQVVSSTASYDTRVAGVISAQPGITLGEGGEGKVLVATTGRVRVKVDASRGPIQIGDLLVTSDMPGVAMKSEPIEFSGRKMHMPGTIIGKALEPLAKGQGEILVLLSLQ